MSGDIQGIHHITAISGRPQDNVDFYCRFLGLRLVKRTVNFDAPDAYHLYFGDRFGDPGSIVTFFLWPDARAGTPGLGQAAALAFAVPEGGLDYWQQRCAAQDIRFRGPLSRFGDERFIALRDPDGLELELVEISGLSAERKGPPVDGAAPEQYAIVALYGVTLWPTDSERSAGFLSGTLKLRRGAEDGDRQRFTAAEGAFGAVVDVMTRRGSAPGRIGAGSIHHVAWRSKSEEEQASWRRELLRLGHRVSSVIDRCYFRSIYFEEPGGVLFEIATDQPGFTVDEPLEQLGTALMLPSWLEPQRSILEKSLPSLRLPEAPYTP